MSETNFSSNLYSQHLERCNNIIGINSLAASWETYRKQISPELLLSLSFCSEILPPDENVIPGEDLSEIEAIILSLKELLKHSPLPQYAQTIVNKHIDKIQAALDSYKIKGAKVFNEVVQSAYGEVIDSAAVFEESKDSDEISKLGQLWQKVSKISDSAVITDKKLSAMSNLSGYATKAIEFIQNMG